MGEVAIVRDIPKLYTAFAEWLSCVMFIILLNRRRTRARLFLILGAFGVLCAVQYLIGYVFPLFLWVPGMFLVMLIMYLLIYSCCEISWEGAGICFAFAFILAEFTAAFEWQIYSWILNLRKWMSSSAFEILMLAVFYFIIYYMAFRMEKRLITDGTMFEVGFLKMCSFILIMLAVFLTSNISYITAETPFSATDQPQIFYIRSLVNFAGLFILWNQQSVLREMSLFRELEMTQSVLKRQYYQYQQSKENIEILNCRYHDLKHQINMIRSEPDAEKKEAYLQEMEQGIRKFETENKTGNPVLDVLLTDKGMVCTQHEIRITTVADGNLLSFMNAMDICTIFGNALDNAIECVEKMDTPEKRLIRVAVFAQQAFLVVRVKNYCESEVVMENALPVTTKADKSSHGYGLKSIRMCAEKYGGSISVTTDQEWFTLCVMIPFPEGFRPDGKDEEELQ